MTPPKPFPVPIVLTPNAAQLERFRELAAREGLPIEEWILAAASAMAARASPAS